MDPNVFRKGDAPSCLVVDKSWDDILDKPAFFIELVDRMIAMMKGAKEVGLILKTTTFGEFKNAINTILLGPLQAAPAEVEDKAERKPHSILVDAFWDEIPQTGEKWKYFKDALAKAYEMKRRIGERQALTEMDSLQSTKDNFNGTVVRSLLGMDDND